MNGWMNGRVYWVFDTGRLGREGKGKGRLKGLFRTGMELCYVGWKGLYVRMLCMFLYTASPKPSPHVHSMPIFRY